MRAHIHLTLGFLGILVIGAIVLAKSPRLQARIRAVAEKLPLIGPVLIKSELGNWARTVGSALDNGSDLLSALRLGVDSLRSSTLKKSFDYATVDIRAGRHIDSALEEYIPQFDPLMIDLIRTGRTSGQFAKMLLFIGGTCEQDTREKAKRLAAITEPLAILLIACIVGTIVISIVLAMTSIYDFSL